MSNACDVVETLHCSNMQNIITVANFTDNMAWYSFLVNFRIFQSSLKTHILYGLNRFSDTNNYVSILVY